MAKVNVVVPLESFNGIKYADLTSEQIKALALFPEMKTAYENWKTVNAAKVYIATVEKALQDKLLPLLINQKDSPLNVGTYRVDKEIVAPTIDEKGVQTSNGLYYTLLLQVSDKRGPLPVTSNVTQRADNTPKALIVDGATYVSATEALISCGYNKGVDGLPLTMSRAAIITHLVAKGHKVG